MQSSRKLLLDFELPSDVKPNEILFRGNFAYFNAYERIIEWEMKSKRESRSLCLHYVTEMIIVESTGELVVGCETGECVFVNLSTFTWDRKIKAHSEVITSIIDMGRFGLATASFDGTVKVWNPTNLAWEHTFAEHESEVYCVAFEEETKRLFSGTGDGKIVARSLETGKVLATMKTNEETIKCLVFLEDFRLVSSTYLGQVIIWNTVDYAQIKVFKDRNMASSVLTRAPSGLLFMAVGSKRIQTFDLDGNKQADDFTLPSKIYRAWISEEGDRLGVIENNRHTVQVYKFDVPYPFEVYKGSFKSKDGVIEGKLLSDGVFFSPETKEIKLL